MAHTEIVKFALLGGIVGALLTQVVNVLILKFRHALKKRGEGK